MVVQVGVVGVVEVVEGEGEIDEEEERGCMDKIMKIKNADCRKDKTDVEGDEEITKTDDGVEYRTDTNMI